MEWHEGTCAWCGGGPLTVEHVFSKKWLARLVRSEGWRSELTQRRCSDGLNEEAEWTRRAGKGGGLEIKAFCKKCNSGWMQVLDEAARPLLTHLCFAETGTIKFPEGNHMIARWATKIALVLDTALAPPAIPQETRKAFFHDKEPPPGTLIWLAAMARSPTEMRQTCMTLVPAPGSPDEKVLPRDLPRPARDFSGRHSNGYRPRNSAWRLLRSARPTNLARYPRSRLAPIAAPLDQKRNSNTRPSTPPSWPGIHRPSHRRRRKRHQMRRSISPPACHGRKCTPRQGILPVLTGERLFV